MQSEGPTHHAQSKALLTHALDPRRANPFALHYFESISYDCKGPSEATQEHRCHGSPGRMTHFHFFSKRQRAKFPRQPLAAHQECAPTSAPSLDPTLPSHFICGDRKWNHGSMHGQSPGLGTASVGAQRRLFLPPASPNKNVGPPGPTLLDHGAPPGCQHDRAPAGGKHYLNLILEAGPWVGAQCTCDGNGGVGGRLCGHSDGCKTVLGTGHLCWLVRPPPSAYCFGIPLLHCIAFPFSETFRAGHHAQGLGGRPCGTLMCRATAQCWHILPGWHRSGWPISHLVLFP